MNIEPLSIPDVLLITPARHGDERGWFSETFRKSALIEAGYGGGGFVQDNHVRSTRRGVLRGLHFQAPPHAQDKLLRCVRGAILDVAVDIRLGSPTFGRWVSAVLSDDNAQQMLVPKGFAHAYCTLSEECEVIYKVSDYYTPASQGALRWNDPDLAIDWTLPAAEVSTNARDAAAPLLADFASPFVQGAMG